MIAKQRRSRGSCVESPYVIAIAVALAALLAAASIGVLWRRAAPQRAAIEALRDAKAALERQLAIEQQRNLRLTELQQELAEARRQADALRDGKAAAEASLAAARAALEGTTKALEAAQAELAKNRDLLGRARADLQGLEVRLASEREQSAEKQLLLEQARESMSGEFRLLANAVMQRHSESFSRQNKEQIEAILRPLGEKLSDFHQGLQAARTEGAGIRAALEQQIKSLTEATAQTTQEAQNLTKALKGQTHTQGAWGEMILESVLERSGLREGEHYLTQQTHATEDGERLRPDVIVRLPREGRLVIDAKVSLSAFEEYVGAETEEQRRNALERHLLSLRTQIRKLGGKDYQSAAGALDYVIMFVPIEGALAAALEAEPAMTGLATECNVAIATPTTLMIALRTVHNVWQIERRTLNAEQIADRAGKLYEKFVGFIADMKKLGDRLSDARACYDAAYAKLYSGGGNLVRQTHQLKELGARTTKMLPSELLALAQDLPAAQPRCASAERVAQVNDAGSNDQMLPLRAE